MTLLLLACSSESPPPLTSVDGPCGPGAWIDVPGDAPTIQAAIDDAVDGDAICVAPGTWYETLDLRGKDLVLHGADRDTTIVDGDGHGPVLTAASGEPASTEIASLTLRGGAADKGGGVYIAGAFPTLRDLLIEDNHATADGGGVYATDAWITLEDVDLDGNVADNAGGGAMFEGAEVAWRGGTVVDNVAHGWSGGGVDFYDGASGSLDDLAILANHADEAGDTGTGGGGGLYLYLSSPTVTNVVIAGNSSLGGRGGGVYVVDENDSAFENVAIVGNRALNGGAWFNRDTASQPRVVNGIVAWNEASDAVGGVWAYAGDVELRYTDIYDNDLSGTMPGAGCLTEEPGLLTWSPDLDPAVWDFHLQADSALRDAGDPSVHDSDGSTSDIGVEGGLGADARWYADEDGDGLFDGWELDHGVDLPGDDPDDDGLDNAGELADGSDPVDPDTDGDGDADGADAEPLRRD